MEIKRNQEITIPNVVAFRKEMTEDRIQNELQSFAMYLKGKDVKKVGPSISTTYGVKQEIEQTVLDIEFLLPINKEIEVSDEYRFLNEFKLTNALYVRHSDPLQSIETTYKEILAYIKDHQLEEITGFYTIQSNEDDIKFGATPVVDIYIGINPNTL